MKIKPTEKPGRVIVELERKDDQLLAASSPSGKAPVPFKVKKILVPIDFSECARKALQYALPFARQFGASITLLHVMQINYAYGEFGAIDYPLLEKELRASSNRQLDDLALKEIGGVVAADALVHTGQPAREIVEAARKLGSDLIIISTHGHSGLKHVLLGSTAEYVVRHAPCPVLTVRMHEHEFITT